LLVPSLIGLAWYALKHDASELGIALPLSLTILLKTYPLFLVDKEEPLPVNVIPR